MRGLCHCPNDMHLPQLALMQKHAFHNNTAVWDSSIVVAKYFERWGNRWAGKRCLDLSAGCGLVGAACPFAAGSNCIAVTTSHTTFTKPFTSYVTSCAASSMWSVMCCIKSAPMTSFLHFVVKAAPFTDGRARTCSHEAVVWNTCVFSVYP